MTLRLGWTRDSSSVSEPWRTRSATIEWSCGDLLEARRRDAAGTRGCRRRARRRGASPSTIDGGQRRAHAGASAAVAAASMTARVRRAHRSRRAPSRPRVRGAFSSSVSTAILLATSPAWCPPRPSATANSGGDSSSASSLPVRTRPMSARARVRAASPRGASQPLHLELDGADLHDVAAAQRAPGSRRPCPLTTVPFVESRSSSIGPRADGDDPRVVRGDEVVGDDEVEVGGAADRHRGGRAGRARRRSRAAPPRRRARAGPWACAARTPDDRCRGRPARRRRGTRTAAAGTAACRRGARRRSCARSGPRGRRAASRRSRDVAVAQDRARSTRSPFTNVPLVESRSSTVQRVVGEGEGGVLARHVHVREADVAVAQPADRHAWPRSTTSWSPTVSVACSAPAAAVRARASAAGARARRPRTARRRFAGARSADTRNRPSLQVVVHGERHRRLRREGVAPLAGVVREVRRELAFEGGRELAEIAPVLPRQRDRVRHRGVHLADADGAAVVHRLGERLRELDGLHRRAERAGEQAFDRVRRRGPRSRRGCSSGPSRLCIGVRRRFGTAHGRAQRDDDGHQYKRRAEPLQDARRGPDQPAVEKRPQRVPSGEDARARHDAEARRTAACRGGTAATRRSRTPPRPRRRGAGRRRRASGAGPRPRGPPTGS